MLDGARAVLETGWVQGTWFTTVQDGTGSGRTVAQPAPPGGTGVGGACLVGAVVRAAGGATTADAVLNAAPAIDVLWDAWQESRGVSGPGLAGRAAPPEIRAARVRDLTRWNDQRGRTRDEVLALIDLASSRAIMEAMQPPVLARAR
jgi:hypothetical protein